jgi:hypothetical protein
VDANGCVSYAPATSFAFNVQDTNTLDLTLAAGVISGNVRISGAAGNQVQALADGLFVPAGAGLQILDTNTVDLTLAGNVLSAQARISTNAGNVLQALANGLFVPAGAGLQIVDTNTIDLTLLGGVLSAQAVISPNAGNALQALPNGLFVPSPSSISVQDTTSVDLTLAGGVLSANVIISTNAGNQLQLLPNGLYVAPSTFSLTVSDTNTVDLNLVGNNLTADVIVSPNAGNALQVLPNGLYVGAGAYSLSDCAGNPLPVGTQVLTCPAGISLLNINDPLIASSAPGTTLRTLSPKNCPEPTNNDYIIIADNTGNVRYTRMNEAIAHNLTPNPIILPNLPLVTLQPPNTTTGTIDSASFTNPRSCFGVFVKGFAGGTLQHSFNQNNNYSTAIARIDFFKDLVSQINNYNTPGITNTPLTGHAWRNQNVYATGFSAERTVDLGSGIAPGGTAVFSRSLFTQGATNFYYVTVEDWNAFIIVVAL